MNHYADATRAAIHAAEREAAMREPQPPEPCNFCAPDDAAQEADCFASLRRQLGRYWLLWVCGYTAIATTDVVLIALWFP